MRIVAVSALILAIAAHCLAAQPIHIPLKYMPYGQYDYRGAPVPIASVKIAPFDLLAPGAGEAPYSLDFNTSSPEHNLACRTLEKTVVEGRACGVGGDDSFELQPRGKTLEGDHYLLVEYFDDNTTGCELIVSYPARIGDSLSPGIPAGKVKLGNSRSWKKEQFRLRNVAIGAKHPQNYTTNLRIRSTLNRTSFTPVGRQIVEVTSSAIAGLKHPTAISTQPLFAKFEMGDSSCTIMLDQDKDAIIYNIVYADLNRNNDLTDDQPQKAKVNNYQSFRSMETSIITTTATVNGLPLRYDFRVEGQQSAGEPSHWMIGGGSSFHGEFDLANRHYELLLYDSDADGRWDERVSSTARTPMRWGSRSTSYASADGLILSDDLPLYWFHTTGKIGFLYLHDQLYDMKVDVVGKRMTLEPYTGPTGKLALTMPVTDLNLTSANGSESVFILHPTTSDIVVPEGNWLLSSYTAEKTDPDGALWKLTGMGTTSCTAVQVAAAKNATLVLGEPYKLELSVPEESRTKVLNGETTAELQLVWVGRGEDMVMRCELEQGYPAGTPMSESLRSDQTREPTFKIVKTDGEFVAQGKFEYG